MQCPYCQAENLEKLSNCYNCGKDLSMLRLVVNKARHHYNIGLEHAERQRHYEAITELKNCLELDKSFVNAYVVLGTVYAKTEEYELAQEMWRQALALDPAIDKAHQYLSKVDTARELRPWLRRLKQLVAACAALCVVLIVIVALSLRPDAQYRNYQQAIQHILDEQLAEALDLLPTIEDTRRHPQLANEAELLTEFINQRLQGDLERLKREVAAHDYAAALATIAQMGRGNFPPTVAEQAQAAYDELLNYKEEDILLLLSSMENDLVTSNTVRQELKAYRSLFAERADAEFEAEVSQRIDAMDVTARIEAIQQQYAQADDAENALFELEALIEDREELREAFAGWIAELSQALVDQRKQAFVEAIEKQQLDRAAELLAARDGWMRYISEEQQQVITESWKSLIRRLESVMLLEELEGLTYLQVARLEELVATLESAELSPEQRTAAAGIVQQLRTNFAEELLADWIRNDYPLQRAKVTDEYARFVQEHDEFVRQHLKPLTARYAGDKLLFYQGSAAFSLQDFERARPLLQQVVDEFPNSPYAKFAVDLLAKINS